jgi:hypothetical protein
VSRNRCPENLAAVPIFHRNFPPIEGRSREEPIVRREIKIAALHEIKECHTQHFEQHLAMETLPPKELSHDNLMLVKFCRQYAKGYPNVKVA